MISYLEYLNVPTKVGIFIIAAFCIMQIIGEIIEFTGKAVPEFFKIRKIFKRRKEERAATTKTLKDVQQLLADVNAHYSQDNISKRDGWMRWVNDRADVYDKSIEELRENMSDIAKTLKDNTTLTEDMFIEISRDRIINFAARAADESALISHEEFNRIFAEYDKYEKYLEEHGMTNGKVAIAYRVIKEAYEVRLKSMLFTENIRGYN